LRPTSHQLSLSNPARPLIHPATQLRLPAPALALAAQAMQLLCQALPQAPLPALARAPAPLVMQLGAPLLHPPPLCPVQQQQQQCRQQQHPAMQLRCWQTPPHGPSLSFPYGPGRTAPVASHPQGVLLLALCQRVGQRSWPHLRRLLLQQLRAATAAVMRSRLRQQGVAAAMRSRLLRRGVMAAAAVLLLRLRQIAVTGTQMGADGRRVSSCRVVVHVRDRPAHLGCCDWSCVDWKGGAVGRICAGCCSSSHERQQ
jgi:hypothetical protein